MDNLKLGLKVGALFLVGFFGIVASSGSLTTGEGLYSVAGVLNFGIAAWADYALYKVLFKKEDK